MINKELKFKILNYYDKKEDRVFASTIIDKINRFEENNYLIHTSFVDLNEKNIAISILNKLDVYYYIFSPLNDTSRFVIFLIPEYMRKQDIESIVSEYISVIKIKPTSRAKLTHREYMGTIYSLGLKEEMIGDIFVENNICHLFCFNKNKEYIFNNLNKVSKYDVSLTLLNVYSDEVKNIKVNYKNMEVIVLSKRVDAVLSEVFLLSRNLVKQKIQNGDLFVNSKEMFFAAYELKENDIVSFRKCGKVKIGKTLRITKSGKTVLSISKYS